MPGPAAWPFWLSGAVGSFAGRESGGAVAPQARIGVVEVRAQLRRPGGPPRHVRVPDVQEHQHLRPRHAPPADVDARFVRRRRHRRRLHAHRRWHRRWRLHACWRRHARWRLRARGLPPRDLIQAACRPDSIRHSAAARARASPHRVPPRTAGPEATITAGSVRQAGNPVRQDLDLVREQHRAATGHGRPADVHPVLHLGHQVAARGVAGNHPGARRCSRRPPPPRRPGWRTWPRRCSSAARRPRWSSARCWPARPVILRCSAARWFVAIGGLSQPASPATMSTRTAVTSRPGRETAPSPSDTRPPARDRDRAPATRPGRIPRRPSKPNKLPLPEPGESSAAYVPLCRERIRREPKCSLNSLHAQTKLFLNGAPAPDADEQVLLASWRITVERAPVAAVDSGLETLVVKLSEGSSRIIEGLFLHPRGRINGPFRRTAPLRAGDGAPRPLLQDRPHRGDQRARGVRLRRRRQPMPAIAYAVADGVRAGTSAHRSLVFRP